MLTNREMVIAGIGVGVGAGVGGTATYFIFNKKLSTRWEQYAEREINVMKIYYEEKKEDLEKIQQSIANQPKPDLTNVGQMAEVSGIITGERYSRVEKEAIAEAAAVEAAEDEERRNVFTGPPDTPEWDYAVEVRSRRPDRPYVIHRDEFMEGKDPDAWQSGSLTYYEGDDVLADESDKIIDADRESVVGDANLSKFGYGSGDPNVVFVRNEVMTIDIEITRSTGTYAAEVHGFIEHQEPRRRSVPRFKNE